MVHAVAIYGAFWIVMLGLKVIGGISGITFLFSPLSFGYSTIVFFILFYLLNKKFNPEKHESVSNALSYMAFAPSAFIVSSALHWEGSHYCQNYFMKDGITWPYPSDYEAGTLTLRIMNRTREECLQDPFNYFGGFESSFNGWLLFFVMLVLGLALLAATVFLFIMLKEVSVKEIISDLRVYKREAEDKVEARAKIVRGIGKTGRETVSWKGKTADVCKEKEFWGEENFIFYRANVLDIIKKEHLKKGDYFVSGLKWGKARAIINDQGDNVNEALPSSPVEILGINGAAKAGDDFLILDTEKEVKSLAEARIAEIIDGKTPVSFATQESAFKDKVSEELNIIIKSDVHGSSEAIKGAISQIKHEEVKPNIVLSDIGMVTETDVTLAKASNAVLIAFNVKPTKEAKLLAEKEKIKISAYNIIYEVLDFIKKRMSGLLAPDVTEKIIGSAEILEIFKVSNTGKIAGSRVTEGEVLNTSNARVIRDGAIIYTGKIGSIFREKNQVKQVEAGQECGIKLKDFNDYQKKDIIEVFSSTTSERMI